MFEFKLDNGFSLKLEKNEKVFTPTGTTEAIIESVLENNFQKKKTLDLGCGCGVIGLTLFKHGLINEPLYASDISDEAISLTKKNAGALNCKIDARKSFLLDEWDNEKFDIIVCDVSSISDEVAKISPWFNSVECKTGTGGDELISKVFKNVQNHAKKNCKFYFPIISLSDVNAIKLTAEKFFKKIKNIKKKNWPLPESMLNNIDLLRNLKKLNKIDFKERFGVVICYTEVYEATLGI